MNLTPEQLAYLKGLESPKKRRKFMLDCLVESVIGESMKFDEDTLVGVQKINTIYTSTTAPRTISESLKDRQEFGTENFDFTKAHIEAVDRIIPKDDELLKFDMLEVEEFEKEIKNNLLLRGFSPSQILNNRGLIGATIQETMSKINESAKSNYTPQEVDMAKNLMTEREKFAENVKKIGEKKWTDEDMRKCFINGMMAEPKHSLNATFEHYFEGFKKRKNE